MCRATGRAKPNERFGWPRESQSLALSSTPPRERASVNFGLQADVLYAGPPRRPTKLLSRQALGGSPITTARGQRAPGQLQCPFAASDGVDRRGELGRRPGARAALGDRAARCPCAHAVARGGQAGEAARCDRARALRPAVSTWAREAENVATSPIGGLNSRGLSGATSRRLRGPDPHARSDLPRTDSQRRWTALAGSRGCRTRLAGVAWSATAGDRFAMRQDRPCT
jgi:hypothetical protein